MGITDKDRIVRLRGVLQSIFDNRLSGHAAGLAAQQAIANDDALERRQVDDAKRREVAA